MTEGQPIMICVCGHEFVFHDDEAIPGRSRCRDCFCGGLFQYRTVRIEGEKNK